MVDKPIHGSRGELRFLALYFVGCLFATALSFIVWRIHPFGASRAAMRSAYTSLSDIASDSARLLKRESTGFRRMGLACFAFPGPGAQRQRSGAQGACPRAVIEDRPA